MRMNPPRPHLQVPARLPRARASLLVVLALVISAVPWQGARALEDLERFPGSALNILTRHGPEWFTVWIADTPARSEQGLMFVKWLPEDRGMLFPQDAPRVMSMWMKNTLIPLDMLFLDERGRVVYIREHATPQSEAIITTPARVKAVLELAGGECAKLGVRVGDQVRHRIFGSSPAGPVRN
jgi:uncharacterized membrane protein (UPF0127 family)